MSHTPGPWTVTKEQGYFPSLHLGPPLPYSDNSGVGDHRITINEGQPPNEKFWSNTMDACMANAHLMSASPDLLALAKHILALETDPYLQGHPEWEAFLNEAKAAENKAEGKPSSCPTCGSPAPHLHPAVQHEGEVQPCKDAFHEKVTPQNKVSARPKRD